MVWARVRVRVGVMVRVRASVKVRVGVGVGVRVTIRVWVRVRVSVRVRVKFHSLWSAVPRLLSHVGEGPLSKPIVNSESYIGASDVFCSIRNGNNTLNS